MNIERLTRLRDLLRADAANPKGVKFDLNAWVAQDRNGGARLSYEIKDGKPVVAPTMSCDTFACALGLACLDPSFQAEGLRFTLEDSESTDSRMTPWFNGETHFEAGAEFFGITDADSTYLFDPECYETTPQEAKGELFVAQRVDDLINGIIDANCHPKFDMRDSE